MKQPKVAFYTRIAAYEFLSENKVQNYQTQRQAFIYARAATTQDDFYRDISLNGQVLRCCAHCEEIGYTIQAAYLETCSGIQPYEKRSGFTSLLREMSEISNPVLVVTQWNRLARDITVMLRMISAVRRCGGSIGFAVETDQQMYIARSLIEITQCVAEHLRRVDQCAPG